MNRNVVLIVILVTLFNVSVGFSYPDYYGGDSTVYSGSSIGTPPNIMLLFDVSDNMTKTGSAIEYDSAANYITKYEELTDEEGQPYESDYISGRVYVQNNTGTANDARMTIVEDDDGYYVSCEDARTALDENGIWMGSLAKGVCDAKADQTYYTGDMACLMFELSKVALDSWNAETAYVVGDVIDGLVGEDLSKFVCVTAGTSGGSEPTWDLSGEIIVDGSVKWEPAKSALAVAASVLKQVATLVGADVNLGVSILNEQNQGVDILQPLINPVGDALTSFNTKMDDLAERGVTGNHWQVNEALWDLGCYYNDTLSDAISAKEKSESYDPAAEYWCQSNNIILITSGLDSDVSQTKGLVEDLVTTNLSGTAEDEQGSSLDVAKHLYQNLDPSYIDMEGHQFHVKTHVIQVMSGFLQQLSDTAHYGNGEYYSLSSAEELKAILSDLILSLLEANSSFVAPVVPASPDNRAYSGQRIYLGFFKPMNDEPWYGNLKKFGLGYNSRIRGFDSSDDEINATYLYPADTNDPALDGFFVVDEDGDPAVRSYWGSDLDGGEVHLGGVGGALLSRDFSSSPRLILTRLVSDDLNASGNQFTKTNANLTATELDVTDAAAKNKLVDFVHGFDAYADFSDVTTIKRPWILGDIMHSKPVVLNYSSYAVTSSNEADADVNQAYIFVGSNDGMLHAFKDATGEEAWAFIPPDLLPNLQYINNTDRHTYFVDNSPMIYVYDKDGDGTISHRVVAEGSDTTDNDDMAILLCGMRRGGGTSTISQPADPDNDPPPSRGSYFALDITDPADPQFLWQINSEVARAGEFGQTWSLPRLTKMQIGSDIKVVAIVGAGYDTNEDLRFGATQTFPNTTDATTITSDTDSGAGDVDSAGTAQPYSPRGRGLYVIEVATLNNGVPNLDDSGTILWRHTYAETSSMKFSMPSDPLVIDRDRDGLTDHIYIADTGGQLWRFNVADSTASNWTATQIFQTNLNDSADVGRKAFYKPTATITGDDTFIYFGTGDREHPLNTAVLDRFYVVRDRQSGENLHDYSVDGPLNESNLVDVTYNLLQDGDTAQATKDLIRKKLTAPFTVTSGETSTAYYGWYLQLNEHAGEKVLAIPKVFSNVLFFSTYTPAVTDPNDADYDPCVGTLGPSRLYAVNAQTAEAVFNLYYDNDTTDENGDKVEVLERPDRYLNVGDGIASEPLIIVGDTGGTSIMVGRGGGFFNSGAVQTIDPVYPIYWMKW